MKCLQVAVAVIRNPQGQILIAKRAQQQQQGGLWEFPGGKLEAGESVLTALARELNEELGIELGTGASAARPLIQVRHDYPDQQVLLQVWEVSAFTGTPYGAEGQPLAWVTPQQLGNYTFPAANRPIVAAARLPAQYLITPEGLAPKALLAGLKAALDAGIRLVQLRAPAMYDPQYRDLAVDAVGLCAGRAQLMLKGPLQWLGDFPAAGWHLTSRQLRELASGGRPFPATRWLAASCHNAEELALASAMGVDFVSLSPLQATQSHPGATPLGWAQAEALMAAFNQPVYLLGGLNPSDTARAWQSGAQGVAGIRAFWPGE
ncbi:MAG: Nudix family hydrolase [Pseudomonas sp.]